MVAAALFLSSVTPLSARLLTGGFASQPRGWFAFIGKEPSIPDKSSNECARRSSAQYVYTTGANSPIVNRLHPYMTAGPHRWRTVPARKSSRGRPHVKNPVTPVTIIVRSACLESGVLVKRGAFCDVVRRVSVCEKASAIPAGSAGRSHDNAWLRRR